MQLTIDFLKEKSACPEGQEWFLAQPETDVLGIIDKLVVEDKWNWANWLICRILNHDQQIKYAVFAAEQVFHLWADKYPKKAAIWRKWVDGGCKSGEAAGAARAAEWAAGRAARAAEWAARAAGAAEWAAGRAARAAEWAARAARAAERAAEWAAEAAGAAGAAEWAAGRAARAAEWAAMKKKILDYGIELFREGDVNAKK